jgi:hypothetical protein
LAALFCVVPEKVAKAPKEILQQADEVSVKTIGLAPQAMSPG